MIEVRDPTNIKSILSVANKDINFKHITIVCTYITIKIWFN